MIYIFRIIFVITAAFFALGHVTTVSAAVQIPGTAPEIEPIQSVPAGIEPNISRNINNVTNPSALSEKEEVTGESKQVNSVSEQNVQLADEAPASVASVSESRSRVWLWILMGVIVILLIAAIIRYRRPVRARPFRDSL